jgi:predicted chitinase
MQIDRDKFLFMYEQEAFKPLADGQKSGLFALLMCIEDDTKIADLRWASYMLATTFHETAGTWQPIAEYGRGRGKEYGIRDAETGQIYFGRGYVQLTWKDNYQTMSKVVGVDLVADPSAAMLPEIAYQIMSYGMRQGSFTGVGLKRYFNEERTDAIGARKIINGTDCAERIAGYYDKFMRILTECVKTETTESA